jgi:hypothetical protein
MRAINEYATQQGLAAGCPTGFDADYGTGASQERSSYGKR